MNLVILDSGTSRHVFSIRSMVKEVVRLPAPIRLTSASGHPIQVHQVGTVQLSKTISIADVAIYPNAPANLISTHRIVSAGFKIFMDDEKAEIIDRNETIVNKFEKSNGLYVAKIKSSYRESKRDGFIVSKPDRQSDASSSGTESATSSNTNNNTTGRTRIPRKPSSASSKPIPSRTVSAGTNSNKGNSGSIRCTGNLVLEHSGDEYGDNCQYADSYDISCLVLDGPATTGRPKWL